MKSLAHNWVVEGRIDFEYKKYLLLAYLQEVERSFSENKVYPFLGDLFEHYNNLIHLKRNKETTESQFPKQLTKVDLEKMHLEYQQVMDSEEYMEEIAAIINFALPQLKIFADEGTELYKYVEDQLQIFPVGVMPLKPTSGYVFIKEATARLTNIYRYELRTIEHTKETYRQLKTVFVESTSVTISNTFEKVKYHLITQYNHVHAPAAYVIESKGKFPYNETLYPIAKRVLLQQIYQESQR